ncbi:hypothetical protein [Agrococcus carbonis]|nr:hypothetical protein [Agrococcus carbonis]
MPVRTAVGTAALLAAVALGGAMALWGGIVPPRGYDTGPAPSAAAPQPTSGTPAADAPPDAAPDAEVVALADAMFLTDEGRSIFFAARPRLVDADAIAVECAGVGDADASDLFTGGCFVGQALSRDADRIFVLRPDDERLHGSMVSIAAHELLHAVYARASPMERAQIDRLVADATAMVPASDPVHEQIEWSVAGDEANRANEQFAYLGSQVAVAGGFPAQLEERYARIFTDRLALVDAHRRADAVVDDAVAAADAAWSAANDAAARTARDRAQLDADRRGYDAAAATYGEDLARFEATPAEEQARWEVTLRPAGGAELTMSWEASLQYRWEELERYRGELAARATEVESAEAEASALRAEAEQRRADALALARAANPNAVIDG